MNLNIKEYYPEVMYYTGFTNTQAVNDLIKGIKSWEPRFPLVFTSPFDKYLDDTLQDAFYEFIYKAVVDFSKRYTMQVDYSLLRNLYVDRQETGHFIQTHVDQDTSDRKIKRQYTMLIYLNDDYEGGEISFVVNKDNIKPENINAELSPKEQKNIDFWIKPEAMSILIMKSDVEVFHTAHLVTQGNKYLIKHFIAELE